VTSMIYHYKLFCSSMESMFFMSSLCCFCFLPLLLLDLGVLIFGEQTLFELWPQSITGWVLCVSLILVQLTADFVRL
jgi:hypothetical protein